MMSAAPTKAVYFCGRTAVSVLRDDGPAAELEIEAE